MTGSARAHISLEQTTPSRTSAEPIGAQRTGACRGVVRGADVPLEGALRAEIVELFAEALVADFIGEIGPDGRVRVGTEPSVSGVHDE